MEHTYARFTYQVFAAACVPLQHSKCLTPILPRNRRRRRNDTQFLSQTHRQQHRSATYNSPTLQTYLNRICSPPFQEYDRRTYCWDTVETEFTEVTGNISAADKSEVESEKTENILRTLEISTVIQ